MEEKRKFGELELQILNILWNGKEMSVSDVQKEIGQKNAYTTIMTVMTRLYQKGYLSRIKIGKTYFYKAIKEKKEEINNILNNLKQVAFNGSTFKLVNYLIGENDKITIDELNQISKLIEEKKEQLKK